MAVCGYRSEGANPSFSSTFTTRFSLRSDRAWLYSGVPGVLASARMESFYPFMLRANERRRSVSSRLMLELLWANCT